MEVSDTTHVVNLNEFEDVVDTDAPFNVWGVLVHVDSVLLIGSVSLEVSREIEQFGVGVVECSRIILVGELSPKHIDTHTLAPFELVDEWEAVE